MDGEPDLSLRDWTTVGAAHAEAFRAASTLRRAQ
jgi:hypothetical protein